MTTADVDETAGTITVYLKGARDQHRVPVTDDFWPLYHRYLEEERWQQPDGQALWLAFRRGQGHPLSYATFESALRYLGHKLGLNVNAHMFRHTLAQGILETTGNLKVAQEILGHAHISTTADQYMHVDEAAMLNALTSVKHAFALASDSALQSTGAAEQLQAGQAAGVLSQYVFSYDRITIEELDQAAQPAQVIKAGGELP
jgi:site-specific recombinase XerD